MIGDVEGLRLVLAYQIFVLAGAKRGSGGEKGYHVPASVSGSLRI